MTTTTAGEAAANGGGRGGGRNGGVRTARQRVGVRPRFKPPIQDIFHRGDEVLVQVIKEGIGTKGPTLSTYISIPGPLPGADAGAGPRSASRARSKTTKTAAGCATSCSS